MDFSLSNNPRVRNDCDSLPPSFELIKKDLKNLGVPFHCFLQWSYKMKDGWHFPLINPVKHFDLVHFLDHIVEEVEEFKTAVGSDESDKEAIDILHAAETFVRKYFEETGRSYNRAKFLVIDKNRRRGYYDE